MSFQPTTKLSPKEILSAGRLLARERAPYFGAALIGLVPRETDGLGTIGVTATGILMWDPAVVGTWTVDQMAGALVHEVGHVLHKHHERFVGRESAIANLAMDLALNPDIMEMGFELPDMAKPVVPKTYGLPANRTAEEYYEGLAKQDKQGSLKPSVGAGFCGSCAQRPMPGEPDDGGKKDPEARSEADMNRMAKQCAEEIVKAAREKKAGSVPGGWVRWAEEQIQPAKVRWQDKLSRTIRQGVNHVAGCVDHTYTKISRRQAGLGFGIGRPVIPALWAPQPLIDVVVDTSGSMSENDLMIAVRETNGILLATGSKVRFTSCDAAVHELKTVKTWREAAKLLKGGGGTAFKPAFDAIAKQKVRPHVIVFITDGSNWDPEPIEPPAAKVIFLLVGPNRVKPSNCNFGSHIEVDS